MTSDLQEVVELAGYTQRVSTMMEVFQDCSNTRWVPTKVIQKSKKDNYGEKVQAGCSLGGFRHQTSRRGACHRRQGRQAKRCKRGFAAVDNLAFQSVKVKWRWRTLWLGSWCSTLCQLSLPTVTLLCPASHLRSSSSSTSSYSSSSTSSSSSLWLPTWSAKPVTHGHQRL